MESWRTCPGGRAHRWACRPGYVIRMQRARRMVVLSKGSAPPSRRWGFTVAGSVHEVQRLRGDRRLPPRHQTGMSLTFPSSVITVLGDSKLKIHRASVLSVGETMQFHAPVEETALKRRTSRLLLPLPVSQRKPKVRELALTSHRLVSLKPLKNGRGVGIKAEFVLREFQGQLAANSSGREKRSEVRRMVTGVERKGAKEFVVLTVRPLFLPPFLLFYCGRWIVYGPSSYVAGWLSVWGIGTMSRGVT